MSFRKLWHNLKFLRKTRLEQYIQHKVNVMIDNLVYELPNNPYNIPKPKIYDFKETLERLCYSNASLIRYGDGEIMIVNNQEIPFQKANPILAKRLKEILISQHENIILCINYQYYYADLRLMHDFGKSFYRTAVNNMRNILNNFIDYNNIYYSAGITSAYITFHTWDFEEWYSKWRTIWNNKKITIICGGGVFKHIKYNIFDNASDIEYMYIPSINAFDKYDNILNDAKKIDKDRLIILIAGPTAKPLAYDLHVQDGFRCLDLGHLAKDYDAYRKGIKTNSKTISEFFKPD